MDRHYTTHPSPTWTGARCVLTVGELQAILEKIEDKDLNVLIADPGPGVNSDWYNVGDIGVPGGEDDDELMAVTLFPADDYDPRQF